MNDAPALDALCRTLCTVFDEAPRADRPGRGKRVAELLRAYAAEHDCWRNWTHFAPDRYSRNLVYRCDEFELLLLCWDVGQESAIHDHAGQQCWMAVLEGTMEEVHYSLPAGHAAPMLDGRVRRFEAGSVAYIDDDIALHSIRPAPGTRGVSLHLYAAAIDGCRAFDPASGRATTIEVGYQSVRGVPCAERSAVEIRAEWAGSATARRSGGR